MARTCKSISNSFFSVSVLFLFVCLLCVVAQARQNPANSFPSPPPTQQAATQQSEPAKPAAAQEPVRTPRQEAELRADLLMARKEYADAVVEYEKLVKAEPRNAVLLNKLGVAYQLQTKLDPARKYYERATKADRNFANAYNNLGTVYYQRKNYKKAVPQYIKAVQTDPQMSVAYSNLGYAYFHLKKYEEAMDAFRRAITLDPEIFERSSRGGSLLQDRTVMADRGLFNFFLAKSFAVQGDALQCARYLKRAIDEGYANVLSARTDAAFKPVLRDPTVRELLQLEPLPPDAKRNTAPPRGGGL
jgi:tetratricopeptide (TPR) repeat protein